MNEDKRILFIYGIDDENKGELQWISSDELYEAEKQ